MRIKERLNQSDFVYGTWCLIPSPEVINILAKAGLDFVLIDMEHGAADYVKAQLMIMAAEAEDCEAIIRVADNDEASILRALDIGASGVIVPHIESVEDREKAISYMKYPPLGVRGFSPYTRAGGYTSKKKHTVQENERILTGIIIEGKSGIKDIGKIIDDPQLDIVYIGTYDLSVSIGVPGDVSHPSVREILITCVDEIRRQGKFAGCLFHNGDELDFFKEIGIQFLAYKVDSKVLYDGFALINELKG
ncbi:MAG: aldolase/citrate lyase family protein [Sphingobacterium sp.]